HEITHVLELAVDRSKPNVGHLVEILEVLHYGFAQCRRGNFAPVPGVDFGLDTADDGIDLLVAHRALVAGAEQAATQFLAIELLARLVLLDYLERRFLDLLDGERAALAGAADAPPPDGEAAAGRARVDDLEVAFVAERTFHGARILNPKSEI